MATFATIVGDAGCIATDLVDIGAELIFATHFGDILGVFHTRQRRIVLCRQHHKVGDATDDEHQH